MKSNKCNTVYTVYDWMVRNPKLKGVQRNVFAVIYGATNEDCEWYTGSRKHLAEIAGMSIQSVVRVLQELVDAKLLEKAYYIQNGVAKCKYKIGKNISSNSQC